jgi:phosphoribosylanthranilate isomerase
MVKVKICGLTNGPDARLAVKLGADFIGFVFYRRSPRAVTLEKAEAVISEVRADCPSTPKCVGVFVNERTEVVRRIFTETGLDIVQLHGDESPEYCRSLGLPYWKAVRLRDASSVRVLNRYGGDAVLLDAFREGLYGGTGRCLPPGLARAAVDQGLRIVIAGGISVDNLAHVLAVQPWAIDVSSALEAEPGKKDAGKMREFFRRLGEMGGRA